MKERVAEKKFSSEDDQIVELGTHSPVEQIC